MQLVIPYKNHVSTTSVLVAEKFEREHKDVLVSIRNLECSDDFRERNFTLSSYKSAQNKELPMFIITRDGFSLLMMSFSGPRAAKFREDFINAFNVMEEMLRDKTPVLLPTYQSRILSEPTKNVPKGHWTIFDKAHPIMFFIEKNVGSVSKYDLVDGSIGRHWSNFRKGKAWAVTPSTYTHVFDDNRGPQESKCYKYAEAEHFETWLIDIYKTKHLFDYLVTKYTNEENVAMLDKVKQKIPLLLNKGRK